MSFAYGTHEVRVVFGAGSLASLPDELERAGMRRVLLLTTPGRGAQRGALEALLGGCRVATFSGATLHVPVEVVAQAREALERARPDALLALGGGSPIGLGKALAHETHLPLAAVVTTYSGSEMTAIWGRSDGTRKYTFRDTHVAPRLVLYDPDLTHGMPAAVSAASGMNAIAHCVEAEYAPERNPVVSFFAMDGLQRLARSLPAVMATPNDSAARSDALFGAHLAGRALDMTSMGLEHKLAHILGGSFGLNHAEAHAALVPWVTAWNAPAAPGAMAAMAEALGVADASLALTDLSRRIGIRTLGQLGITPGDIPRIAELAMALTFPNPRPVDAEGVRWIVERAL